ncbi:MAG: porin [Candidatus Puniceispirillaceae bacterium]
MKKILLATTALFALSGISVAAADVSLSGHVRYHYDSWSDEVVDADGSGNNNNSMGTDAEIWIKGNMVTDNGLTVAPEIRLNNLHDGSKPASGRHYIKLSDDWGTLTLGRQHSVGRTMSLDAEWRGTVSGGFEPVGANKTNVDDDLAVLSGDDLLADKGMQLMTNSAIGAYAGPSAIIYQTPNISGFQAGVYFGDAGGTSKANATDIALTYSLDAFSDGGVKVAYISNSVNAADNKATTKKFDNNQIGFELNSGDFMASVNQTKKKGTPKSSGMTDKQTAQELELAYTASDSLTVNTVIFSSKVEEGASKNDKYKSTGVGAKYTIAPGLYASLGYTTFTYTPDGAGAKKNKGNGMRLRVHAGF